MRQSQRLNDGRYVVGLRVQIVARGRLVRFTPTAKVRSNAAMSLGQRPRHQIPSPPGAAPVVDEDKGGLVASDLPDAEIESVCVQLSSVE